MMGFRCYVSLPEGIETEQEGRKANSEIAAGLGPRMNEAYIPDSGNSVEISLYGHSLWIAFWWDNDWKGE